MRIILAGAGCPKDSSGYLEYSDESVSGGYIIAEAGRTKLNQNDKRLTVNVTLS